MPDSIQAKPKGRVGRRGQLAAPGQRLIGVDGFAATLGVSVVTAYRILRRGEISVVKIGGRTLIAVAAIDAYIASRTGAFLAPTPKPRQAAQAAPTDAFAIGEG